MALLFERSALWRTIVRATRDPRVLFGFTVVTFTGGYFVAKGAELSTSHASEKTGDEVRESLKKDWEAARYAEHSKNALAVMFESFQKPGEEVAENEKYKKNPIKLPGVMWHPSIQKKEQKRLEQEQQKSQISSKSEAQQK